MEALKAAARKLDNAHDDLGVSVGTTIEADFHGEGSYYPGTVVKVHTDGSCDIDYSDGDQEFGVPMSRIRVLATEVVRKAGEELNFATSHSHPVLGREESSEISAGRHLSPDESRPPNDSPEQGQGAALETKQTEITDDNRTQEPQINSKADDGDGSGINKDQGDLLLSGHHREHDRESNDTLGRNEVEATQRKGKAMPKTTVSLEISAVGHLPPNPRPLSDLPKGSSLGHSILKLSQRNTPPRELRAALKDSVQRILTGGDSGGEDDNPHSSAERKEGESKEADGRADSGGWGLSEQLAASGRGSGGHEEAEAELSALFVKDFSGWNALHWAASSAQVQVAIELLSLERNALRAVRRGTAARDEDDADDDNHHRRSSGDHDREEEAAGASGGGGDSGRSEERLVDARDFLNGWTPLHLAAVGGSKDHFRVARVLIERGADIDAQDSSGDAPRDVVSARGVALADWSRLLSENHLDAPTPRLRKPSSSSSSSSSEGGRHSHHHHHHDTDRHHRRHADGHHHGGDSGRRHQKSSSKGGSSSRRRSSKSRERSHQSRHERSRY